MKDIVFSLQIPKPDIWYVQNILETMDGLALVTSANMKDNTGFFEIYITDDFLPLFHQVFTALQSEIPSLSILKTEMPSES
jgi:hypothetical protein